MSMEQFPGFKVSPNDPSREIRRKSYFQPVPPTYALGDDEDDGEDVCQECDGLGYVDCFCGGDLCVCEYHGEIPCFC